MHRRVQQKPEKLPQGEKQEAFSSAVPKEEARCWRGQYFHAVYCGGYAFLLANFQKLGNLHH